MITSVVIATDGSASVDRAIAVATDIASRFEATIHAVYVLDEGEIASTPEAIRADLQDSLEEQGKEALNRVSDETDINVQTAVRTGQPAAEIIEYVQEVDADLVAIGTRGRHGEHRLMIGSVAEALVRRCPIPVLTVRQLSNPSGSADT